MNIRTDLRMDKAQFFDWLERQEERYELADGRPVTLPFVTRTHERICSNVLAALFSRLSRDRFDVARGDFAIETGEHGIRYADIVVEPFGIDGSARSTTSAFLLVEVLSPSTMHVDFGPKRDEYLRLPLLGTYLICAQDQPRAWVWTRIDGRWPDAPALLEGVHATVSIPILGIALPLSELYANVLLRG